MLCDCGRGVTNIALADVLLQPRDYSPSYLSIIVSSLDRLVVPSISLLVLAVAFVGPSYN